MLEQIMNQFNGSGHFSQLQLMTSVKQSSGLVAFFSIATSSKILISTLYAIEKILVATHW
jgi:hypothetical protein